jgi:hypothetical protein
MINYLYGLYLKVEARILGAVWTNPYLKAFVLVPVYMVFGKRWEKHYKELMASAALEKTRWFDEHTDPVFGRPPDTAYFNKDRIAPDGKIYEVYKYRPPFRPCRVGTLDLETDQSASIEQREMFLWLESKMDAIAKLVPGLLLTSSEDDLAPGSCFFGVPKPEEAATAFDSQYIDAIWLKGVNPVKWKIRFNATIEQDVGGYIEGEDEIVRRACLYM